MKPSAQLNEEFLLALRTVPTPVAVVTCFVDGRPWGLTVSAVCSVSAEPPKMLVSIFTRTAPFRVISTEGHFGISFVATGHLRVADFASRPNMPKFIDSHVAELDLATSPEYGWHGFGGPPDSEARGNNSRAAPMLPSAYCHMDCSLSGIVPVADHALIIGDVIAVTRRSDPDVTPVVWWNRAFHEIGPEASSVGYDAAATAEDRDPYSRILGPDGTPAEPKSPPNLSQQEG